MMARGLEDGDDAGLEPEGRKVLYSSDRTCVWQVHVHRHTLLQPLLILSVSSSIYTQPKRHTQNAPRPLA